MHLGHKYETYSWIKVMKLNFSFQSCWLFVNGAFELNGHLTNLVKRRGCSTLNLTSLVLNLNNEKGQKWNKENNICSWKI